MCRLTPSPPTPTHLRFCLADQRGTLGSCGTFDPALNAYTDGCAQASITNVGVTAVDVLSDPGQASNTFYTVQDIDISWTPVNIVDDTVKIYYVSPTTGVRSIAASVNASLRTFRWRIPDAATSLGLNAPVFVALTNAANLINATAASNINILASAAANITAQTMSGPMAGRAILSRNPATNAWVATNITAGEVVNVQWTATGYAKYGTATVQLLRKTTFGVSGPWGAVTSPLTGSATPEVTNFTVPTGNGPNNNYYFQVVVTTPNGASFSNAAGGSFGSCTFTQAQGNACITMVSPTPSPTASPTPTPSNTPSPSNTASNTPSPSNTASPSSTPTPSYTPTPSPSESRTPTPSNTPSITPTSTQSESARPTVDIAGAIARATADSGASTGPIIGAVLGTAVALVVGFLGYMAYQRHKLTTARLRKLKDNANWASSSRDVYFGKNGAPHESISSGSGSGAPMIVYQVGRGGGRGNGLTGPSIPAAAAAAYRAPTPASAGGPAGRRGYAPTGR